IEKLGYVVGPDLAALTDKSPASLLKAIVDPNATVDRRYSAYVAETTEGQVFTGIMAAESVSNIVLRTQEGKDKSILRDELAQLQSTGKSLMPEGLVREIPPSSMQDLLAFLIRGQSKFPSVNQISDLLADAPGSEEQRLKIPAIWSIAIEAGQRN